MSVSLMASVVFAGSIPFQIPQSASPDTSIQVAQATATITPAAIMAYRTALQADSMRGVAPSPAVDRAARYVAEQFRALGFATRDLVDTGAVQPQFAQDRYVGGIHRYLVPHQFRVDYRRSHLKIYSIPHADSRPLLSEQGWPFAPRWRTVDLGPVGWAHDTAVAPYVRSTLNDFLPADAAVLVAGRQSLASIRQIDVHRRTVLYAPPLEEDPDLRDTILRDLATRSSGVVILGEADSAAFARQRQDGQAHPPELLPSYLSRSGSAWVVEVWPGALAKELDIDGIDMAALRSIQAPVVRQLPFLVVDVEWSGTPLAGIVTAPNVMAVLPGRDSALTRDKAFVAIVAVLDSGLADDSDHMRSVASLLALAHAFSDPQVRPRRPLVFLAVSGGEQQWGASYFMTHGGAYSVPSLVVMLDIRNPGPHPRLFVDGGHEVAVTPPPAWVGTLHPELGIAVVDTGSVFSSIPAVLPFTAQLVPTLAFRAGMDDSTSSRAPSMADNDVATARLLQGVFYLISDWANADIAPRWTSAVRQQLQAVSP